MKKKIPCQITAKRIAIIITVVAVAVIVVIVEPVCLGYDGEELLLLLEHAWQGTS